MTVVRSAESCVCRLLIADDRVRTRRALRAVLALQPGRELIGEAADGEEVTVGELGIVAPNIGGIPWESWTEWTFSLVLTWFLGFSLRKQQRLVTELDLRGQELEHRGHELERRGQDLEMLLTVSGSVASTLDMRQLLEAVFDALGGVLDYSAIAVLTLNESQDALTVAAGRGPTSYTTQQPQPTRYSLADLGGVWDRLSQDEPIVIADMRGGTPEAASLRAALGAPILTAGETFVPSLMLVPLVARGQIIGVLAVTNGLPTAFGDRETSLALGIARQAAVANRECTTPRSSAAGSDR
jgi:transcriptional regulator with GAF, ATPase, and Fis domain